MEVTPITLGLIAITVAISLLAWRRQGWMQRLIYWPPAVNRGEWWRLLTHGLIHADGAHLFVNMLVLFFFGSTMERVLTGAIGPVGFALFYIKGVCPPSINTVDIYKGVAPFVLLQLLGLMLVFFFEPLATWLPNLMYS